MVQFNLAVPLPELVSTKKEANRLLEQLLRHVESDPDHLIGGDTETYGKKIPLKFTKGGKPEKNNPLDWMRDTVTFWSLSTKLEGQYRRWCLMPEHLHMFIPLLENPDANLCFWNLKYDAHVLWNTGIYLWGSNALDGLVMGSLVDENLQGQLDLKTCAGKAFPFFHPDNRFDSEHIWQDLINEGLITEWDAIPMTKFKDLFPEKDEKGNKINEFEYSLFELHKRWPEKVADYASLDAYACVRLVEHLRDVLSVIPVFLAEGETTSLWNYYQEMEVPITETLWRMERRGMLIDKDYLKKIAGPMQEEIADLEKEINNVAGWMVNPESNPDVVQLLFGSPDDPDRPGLGLTPVKMTKGGKTLPKPSADKDVLEELADNYDVPVAKLLKRRKKVRVILSTFVQGCLKLSDWHEDGRLHPKFNQYGAKTGRFSTNNPNSQNLPRPDTDEFGIRRAFIAAVKKKLIVVDYSQLEMRIMAHFSQDKGMIDAINQGLDLHCFAVEKMYKIPYAEVIAAKKRADIVKWDDLTPREQECLHKRQVCKNTGFAIIYGAGAPRISSMLGIEEEEAEGIIHLYFMAFPGVKRFMVNTVAECKFDGFVTTLVGRRRNLPDIRSANYIKRSATEREAVNAPIQGSAADITKAAMLNIEYDEELLMLGVTLLNQIHDELVMECPEETAEIALPRIKFLMERPFDGEQALCVPTPVSAKIVDRWDQAK